MSKKMLINATHLEENRVAIVQDGVLSELDIEIAGKEQTKGNIYKAVVVRVETGLQAAFIDYGGERLGFLQMGELHPNYFRDNGEGKGRPRIADVLRRGQELLVQIVKEERGTKGAALTTFLSLPGRYMVLMPESDSKGISRKIEDESQRKQLKAAMASLDLPDDMGYIVRTAGIGQSKEELKRDFDYLVRLYQNIQALGKKVKGPALIYKESNLVIRSIRDYFSADMDEVLVDDPKVFDEAKEFFQQVMPEYARLVKLHQERRPIFARYQIEEQIETISKNKVPLPSGGSIVIDQTEALVAVDVNSGKMAGESGVESTAYKSNLEAAVEVGRQLRLRDLGGLIVIDFIDMRDRKHIREVEKCLKDALKNDKARVTIGRISQFGLLEMSRQRIKAALAEGAYLPCPHCQGSGKVKSPEAQAVAFMRKIQAGVAKGQIGMVEGEVPLDVATYLLNHKRGELHAMERQYDLAIVIKGHPGFIAGQAEVSFHKREQEQPAPEYVSAADAVSALEEAAEPAAREGEPAAEAPAAEGEGKKKRRRRKKKKGAAEEGAAEAAEAATGEEVEVEEPAEAGEEEAAEAEEAGEEVAAEAAPGEGKKKRRRRRRKKKGGAEAATEEAATEEAATEEAATEEAATEEAATEEVVAEEAVSEEIAAEEVAVEEVEPAKPKRRRSRKKPAGAPAAAPQAAEETPAAPTEEPPREAATAVAPPAAEQAVEPAPAEEAPAKKPAPRKKKPAAKLEVPAEAPAAEEQAVEPVPSEEAPAKKPAPRKKKPAAKTEAPAAAPAAEEQAVEPAPAEEAPAKKPAPRKKKPAAKAEAPAEEQAVEPAPAEKAPAKKRAPRQKKEAETPAEAAKEGEAKPKRSRKKAEPETPAE